MIPGTFWAFHPLHGCQVIRLVLSSQPSSLSPEHIFLPPNEAPWPAHPRIQLVGLTPQEAARGGTRWLGLPCFHLFFRHISHYKSHPCLCFKTSKPFQKRTEAGGLEAGPLPAISGESTNPRHGDDPHTATCPDLYQSKHPFYSGVAFVTTLGPAPG